MKRIYGIPIFQGTMNDALETFCCSFVAPNNHVVCLVNTLSLVEAHRDPTHMQSLQRSSWNLADGWPVAALARTPKIAGADLMLAVARHPTLGRMRHTLYGGFGVAYNAAVRQWTEGGRQATILPPWLPEYQLSWEMVETINATKPDLLWVALGCPKQEAWIFAHRDELKAKVIIGVGAAFNYLAGAVKRAPRWMQRCGLEGVFRIWEEPLKRRHQAMAGIGLIKLLLFGRSPTWTYIIGHHDGRTI